MMPSRTRAPRTIHSQMRSEASPLDDAGEVAGLVGAVVGASVGLTTLGVGDGVAGVGDSVRVVVAGAVATGEEVVTAPLALCTHAAARPPAPAMTAASSTPFTRRRIPRPSTLLIMAESAGWRHTRHG